MTTYRFPLERLLRLRLRRERDEARLLRDALAQETARRAMLDQARARLTAWEEQTTNVTSGLPRAGMLETMNRGAQGAAADVEQATQEHRATVVTVEECQQRFALARRDRRSLERLRDRRAREWHEETLRVELREGSPRSVQPTPEEESRT